MLGIVEPEIKLHLKESCFFLIKMSLLYLKQHDLTNFDTKECIMFTSNFTLPFVTTQRPRTLNFFAFMMSSSSSYFHYVLANFSKTTPSFVGDVDVVDTSNAERQTKDNARARLADDSDKPRRAPASAAKS